MRRKFLVLLFEKEIKISKNCRKRAPRQFPGCPWIFTALVTIIIHLTPCLKFMSDFSLRGSGRVTSLLLHPLKFTTELHAEPKLFARYSKRGGKRNKCAKRDEGGERWKGVYRTLFVGYALSTSCLAGGVAGCRTEPNREAHPLLQQKGKKKKEKKPRRRRSGRSSEGQGPSVGEGKRRKKGRGTNT